MFIGGKKQQQMIAPFACSSYHLPSLFIDIPSHPVFNACRDKALGYRQIRCTRKECRRHSVVYIGSVPDDILLLLVSLEGSRRHSHLDGVSTK